MTKVYQCALCQRFFGKKCHLDNHEKRKFKCVNPQNTVINVTKLTKSDENKKSKNIVNIVLNEPNLDVEFVNKILIDDDSQLNLLQCSEENIVLNKEDESNVKKIYIPDELTNIDKIEVKNALKKAIKNNKTDNVLCMSELNMNHNKSTKSRQHLINCNDEVEKVSKKDNKNTQSRKVRKEPIIVVRKDATNGNNCIEESI